MSRSTLSLDAPKLYQVREDLGCSPLKITCAAMRREGYAYGNVCVCVQVIPPNSTAKFPVTFQATKVQQYHQSVEYIINGCQIFTFQVHHMCMICTAVILHIRPALPASCTFHAGSITRQLSRLLAPPSCISVGRYQCQGQLESRIACTQASVICMYQVQFRFCITNMMSA